MKIFDPIRDIAGSRLILEPDGSWPNFHDAAIHVLNIWRGDIRPDENVYIGPVIETTLELTALEHPFIAVLKFHDCHDIEMSGFDHNSEINDLKFEFEERGFYVDNKTPLSPYIRVTFEKFTNMGLSLKLRCFRVEVTERREIGTWIRNAPKISQTCHEDQAGTT